MYNRAMKHAQNLIAHIVGVADKSFPCRIKFTKSELSKLINNFSADDLECHKEEVVDDTLALLLEVGLIAEIKGTATNKDVVSIRLTAKGLHFIKRDVPFNRGNLDFRSAIQHYSDFEQSELGNAIEYALIGVEMDWSRQASD